MYITSFLIYFLLNFYKTFMFSLNIESSQKTSRLTKIADC